MKFKLSNIFGNTSMTTTEKPTYSQKVVYTPFESVFPEKKPESQVYHAYVIIKSISKERVTSKGIKLKQILAMQIGDYMMSITVFENRYHLLEGLSEGTVVCVEFYIKAGYDKNDSVHSNCILKDIISF